jgi:TRAP-type mannitol/chloroaromatic compound transport system permease large subunit
VLVVLGDQLAIAHQNAELAKGNLAPVTVTVADLFAGALVPGLLLAALYMLYQAAVALSRPGAAPPLPRVEPPAPAELIRVLVAPLVLILAVLGSILAGLATPTEAASVGAVGATLLAARRIAPGRAWLVDLAAAALLLALLLAALFDLRLGRLQVSPAAQALIALALALVALALAGVAVAFVTAARSGVLRPVLESTLAITTMIFMLLLGATIFSLVFRGLGGDATVHGWLSGLPGGALGAVAAVMLAMFLLGFFLDFLEIVFVVVPIVAPVLLRMEGIDPVWLGVMMAINMQTSFMHPPLGATLFYLRSVAPAQVKTVDLYLGTVPFVGIQLLALVVLWFVPGLATWLPRVLYGG